jgi:hypothetical protein
MGHPALWDWSRFQKLRVGHPALGTAVLGYFMTRPPAPGIPRLHFALCLPVQIGYVDDYRMFIEFDFHA